MARYMIDTSALNRTARDSYPHAPEPECRSVRHAHENRGIQGRRAHSARSAECANLMHLGLVKYYHPEGGSHQVIAVTDDPGNILFISRIGLVEIHSALARKVHAAQQEGLSVINPETP